MSGNDRLSIAISPRALETIGMEAQRSRDGLETGGILLGTDNDEEGPIILLAGGPGPEAVRRPHFFNRDGAYAQHLSNVAWLERRAQWIGEWHTHLTRSSVPSAADLSSYARHLADPELGFDRFFSLVVTVPSVGSPQVTAWTIDRHAAYLSLLQKTSTGEPL